MNLDWSREQNHEFGLVERANQNPYTQRGDGLDTSYYYAHDRWHLNDLKTKLSEFVAPIFNADINILLWHLNHPFHDSPMTHLISSIQKYVIHLKVQSPPAPQSIDVGICLPHM